MSTVTIQEFKDSILRSMKLWIESRIDELVTNNPKLSVASVYLKRGAKNFLLRENEKITGMIDEAAMFICDENGNLNVEILFDDLMKIFKNMDEIPFGKGLLRGTIGKGVIRFALPDNPVIGLLFGDTGAIKITEADLLELKTMLTNE